MKKIFFSMLFSISSTFAQVPTLDQELLLNYPAEVNRDVKETLFPTKFPDQTLTGKKVAILVADGVEEIEVLGTMKFLRDRGATAHIVSPRVRTFSFPNGVRYPENRKDSILTIKFIEPGQWLKIDAFVDSIAADTYQAYVIPGGTWSPDTLRIDKDVQGLLKSAHSQGILIAAICHGPQVLIDAGLVKGTAVTGTENILQDLRNAGGLVRDYPLIQNNNIITSRHPLDLAYFLRQIEGTLKSL